MQKNLSLQLIKNIPLLELLLFLFSRLGELDAY